MKKVEYNFYGIMKQFRFYPNYSPTKNDVECDDLTISQKAWEKLKNKLMKDDEFNVEKLQNLVYYYYKNLCLRNNDDEIHCYHLSSKIDVKKKSNLLIHQEKRELSPLYFDMSQAIMERKNKLIFLNYENPEVMIVLEESVERGTMEDQKCVLESTKIYTVYIKGDKEDKDFQTYCEYVQKLLH